MDRTCLRAFLYNRRPKRWRQRISKRYWVRRRLGIGRRQGISRGQKCGRGGMNLQRLALIVILCESVILIWWHGGALSLLAENSVEVSWEESVLPGEYWLPGEMVMPGENEIAGEKVMPGENEIPGENVMTEESINPDTGKREQGFLVNLKELTMKIWQTESFLIEKSLEEQRD